MYEFRLINLTNDNEKIIFGYDYNNACKRANIDPEEWEVYDYEYID